MVWWQIDGGRERTDRGRVMRERFVVKKEICVCNDDG